MSSETVPRFGLLNMMPSSVFLKTEHQWRDSFGDRAEIIPLCFDDDPRPERGARGWARSHPISEVQDQLDGLIVTGGNMEKRADGTALPFEEIEYHGQLKELIDWSEANTRLSIYSCLASHIALNYLFDLKREIGEKKTFGVFDHEVVGDSYLTAGIGIEGSVISSPHSRWGGISSNLLVNAGVELVAVSDEAGWLLATHDTSGHQSVFIQGHPEYQRDDLHKEYERDLRDEACTDVAVPANYYRPYGASVPQLTGGESTIPRYQWFEDASTLFTNIAKKAADSKILV